MKLQQTSAPAPPCNGQPLFYVVDWLPPDFGAVGQYALIYATETAASGRHVELIGLTSGDASVSEREFSSGGFLRITRVPASTYNKSRNLKRLLWALRTNFRLMSKVVWDRRAHGAEVIFTGSPPFMLLFSFLTKLFRGAKLTYRITDFFPEVIAADAKKSSALLKMLERTVWTLRRKVDGFQVLGEDQRQLLIKGGISPDRIVLQRDSSPIYISGFEEPAQRPNGLGRGPVLLYSGNYGVAHEADTVVDGLAEHYRRNGGRLFSLWLNATGARADSVELRLRSKNIGVARTPPAPLDQLPSILAAADVHLITLRPEFVGIVLPSKVYGCISSRRPILFVGPTSSDVHLLCSQADNPHYEQVDPGDVFGFADALDRLAVVVSNNPPN